METYNYNYQQIQFLKNYPKYENSTNEIKYGNNSLNNYPNYEMKTFSPNQNELNFENNIYNIQTTNITNINYPTEQYIINKDQNINKIPKDAENYEDKMPKDNIKGKQNLIDRNSLMKDNYNHNKINRIEFMLYDNVDNNKEKQPKDNHKKYVNDVELKQNEIKKKNLNIKINIKNNNSKEKNNEDKINYLKTNGNYIYEFNPLKTSKRNSIKTIERIKKNNYLAINDLFNNKKIKKKKSPDSKEIKNKIFSKSKNKKNNPQIIKKSLNKNFSTNKLKEKSDSNFASLINKKKIKMFSSFKLIHDNSNSNNNPKNSNEINKVNTDKIILQKKPEKDMKTIGIKKNNGRLYSPQITSTNNKINRLYNQIEIKKTKEILNKKKNDTNIKTTKKINNNNNTNNNSNLKNRASSFRTIMEKNTDFTNKKINEENSNNNIENEDNYDIMNNFIQKAYNRKTANLKKINEMMNENSSNQEKIKSKKKINNHKIIRKQLSLKNSKKNKDDENNKLYNPNTMRISRKKVIYSRGKDTHEKNEIIINQKRNLFTFMKKTQRNNSNNSYNKLSDEKIDMHNKSYKGFSSVKKLEEIKKKYKFYPHNKESKNVLKDKYIDYTSENNVIIHFINSMEFNKCDEVRNLNLTEFLHQKDINKIEEDFENKKYINNDIENSKIIENEEDKEEENENNENEEDKLNHKSFILNLNNVIPINEKKLRDTINKESIIISNKAMKIKNQD